MTPALQQARKVARRHAKQLARVHTARALDRGFDEARVQRRRKGPFRMRLWVPVSLLWIFYPLVLLITPIAMAWRVRPARLAGGVAELLLALSGIEVEVKSSDTDILIRLF